MNTLQTRQEPRRATMHKSMTCQTFTLTNDSTGQSAKITIVHRHSPLSSAVVEAYPATDTRELAARYGYLATAEITIGHIESPANFTQRVHNEAASLGMDTLRELARPVLRDVPTSGES